MSETALSLLAAEFRDPFAAVGAGVLLLRLGAAALLGAAIGFERELHASSAGLRTHIIVSLAACLFTLIAAEIMAHGIGAGEPPSTDPLRLIEAVTAGVAFLAAGSIITSGGRITGLTTGAGMWMAGAIGLACGSGLVPLAAMATVLTVTVLWLLRRVSRRIAAGEDPAGKDRHPPEARRDAMPAKSKAQQRAAGAALAAKRGEMPAKELKGASRGMFDSMSEKELEDLAATAHEGLPDRLEDDD